MRSALLFILYLLPAAIAAQSPDNEAWCPPGATWIYQRSGNSPTAYIRYQYDTDTLMAGRLAKKMRTTVIFFAGPPGTAPQVSAGTAEFYHASNDSLFWWNNGQFQFLYDFNALPGARWVARNSRYQPCTAPGFPQHDTVVVRSLRKDTLGSRIYTRLVAASDSQYFHTGPILRRIGSMLAPWPLQNTARCIQMSIPGATVDPYDFTALVCYSDNLRGTVPLFSGNLSGSNCSALMAAVVTSVSRLPAGEEQLRLQPNPAREQLRVSGVSTRTGWRICAPDGRTLASGRLQGGTVPLAGLTPGLYLLELTEKGQRRAQLFVKQ